MNFLKDKKTVFFLVLIFGAIFLRVYHFEDWMIFKSDQVRDAMVTNRVLEDGVGALPLLGPRAGGTNLRLGPIFYYFQSMSGYLFMSASPGTLAFPNLLFSILTIPIFFFLVRIIFDRYWSLFLTTVFSYGFLAIEYSRFSWNPNALPFFSLLFLYAFLKIFSENSNKKYRWYFILGLTYAISSQLHFVSLLALPIFSLLFLMFRWRRFQSAFSWQGLLIFFAVGVFFYVPVIASDIINHGKNAELFLKSIGTKESDASFFQNISQDVLCFGQYFFRIAFGYLGEMKWLHLFGSVFFLAGLIGSGILFWRKQNDEKKDFFLAMLLWPATFFFLYIPLATTIDKPRFFLPMIFVPVIYMGMAIFFFENGRGRVLFKVFVAGLLCVSLFSNVFFVYVWLSEIQKSTVQYIKPSETTVLRMKKDTMWWTWGQIRSASEFIMKDCPYENVVLVFQGKSSEFTHNFIYAFDLARDPRFRRSEKYNGPSVCRYHILKANPEVEKPELYRDFGDLRVVVLEKLGGEFDLSTRNRNTNDDTPEEVENQRAYWKDVFLYFSGK